MAADTPTGTLATAVAVLDEWMERSPRTTGDGEAASAAWANVRRVALEPAPLPPPPDRADVGVRAAGLLGLAKSQLTPLLAAAEDPIGVALVAATTTMELAALAVESLGKIATAVQELDETLMAAHGVSRSKDPAAPPPAGYLEDVLEIARSNDGPTGRALRLATVRERYKIGGG